MFIRSFCELLNSNTRCCSLSCVILNARAGNWTIYSELASKISICRVFYNCRKWLLLVIIFIRFRLFISLSILYKIETLRQRGNLQLEMVFFSFCLSGLVFGITIFLLILELMRRFLQFERNVLVKTFFIQKWRGFLLLFNFFLLQKSDKFSYKNHKLSSFVRNCFLSSCYIQCINKTSL